MNKSLLSNATILVTGGTGFLGENFIHALPSAAKVISVSQKPKIYREFVTYSTPHKIQHMYGNLLDRSFMKRMVTNAQIIVHLAGHSGTQESLRQPLKNLEINCKGTLQLLEICKTYQPRAIILLIGSQLGKCNTYDSATQQQIFPTSIYGIHHATISMYGYYYAKVNNLNIRYLRLPIIYGPHSSPSTTKYNIANHFIDLALQNKTIQIFGKGNQKRDYLYIEDAVAAMIKTIHTQKSIGKIIDIGTGKGTSVLNFAQSVINTCKTGTIRHVLWPYAPNEHYFKINTNEASKLLDWTPKTKLNDGIKQTIKIQQKILSY